MVLDRSKQRVVSAGMKREANGRGVEDLPQIPDDVLLNQARPRVKHAEGSRPGHHR